MRSEERVEAARAFTATARAALPPAASTTHLAALRDALAALHPLSPLPVECRPQLAIAIDSYLDWATAEFAREHDHFRLVGEDNFRRYLPIANLWVRIHPEDSPFDVFARACAGRAAGCRVVVSRPPKLPERLAELLTLLDTLTDPWAAAIEFVTETDAELGAAMQSGRVGRVRYAAPDRVPDAIRRASAESMVYVADAPPLAHGRFELLWCVQEQSLSHVYHRYGNLGRRAQESRAPVE